MNGKSTNAQFGKSLGISERTLTRWKQQEGFPHGSEPAEVRKWAESVGLGRSYDRDDSADLRILKAELIREQIELARAKNSRERRSVIEREAVESAFAILGQKLDLLLRLKLEIELGPRVVGKSAAEANAEGARILDEIREVVNSNIARFEADVLEREIAQGA
jgi:hypothetical protein